MHPKFLPLLCSPRTGAPLELVAETLDTKGNIQTGELITADEKERYFIEGGVPRFVDQEQYTSTFGYEWKAWPRLQFEEDNRGGVMQGFTQKMFDTVTEFTSAEIKDKLVVEFGCGPGRFLDRVVALGGLAVGLELSQAADVAFQNFADQQDRVLIVQGDILHPPFKSGVFDHGFTIGVLHHTPNPGEGFKQLARTVKAGGRVVCRVYARGGFYGFPSVRLMRFFHRTLERLMGNEKTHSLYRRYAAWSASKGYAFIQSVRRVPLVGKPLAYILEHYFIVSVNLPDERWRMLDVFDASTPFHASTHTAEEIQAWYRAAGIQEIRHVKGGNTFSGISVTK